MPLKKSLRKLLNKSFWMILLLKKLSWRKLQRKKLSLRKLSWRKILKKLLQQNSPLLKNNYFILNYDSSLLDYL